MRNKNEIMRIVADNTDFQNYYNELKDYFEKYKPYSRFFYDENIQIGLDNISQMLIEKCKIYKYKEWYCAMYESLEYLIGEDRLTQKNIEERIDMIWRGREHNFDTLNNKNKYVTMEGYARLQFPWIFRLAMADKSFVICCVYLFFVDWFIMNFLFDKVEFGENETILSFCPFFISFMYGMICMSPIVIKNNFVLCKIFFLYMFLELIIGNYIFFFADERGVGYDLFIHNYLWCYLLLLPVIPVDIAHLHNYFRKSMKKGD